MRQRMNLGESGEQQLLMDMTEFDPMTSQVPSALKLLRNDPQHSGMLYKRSTRGRFMCPCLKRTWNRRLFIIKGKFLFRYASEASEKPKGTPLPLECAKCEVLQSVDSDDDHYFLKVSSLRKEYILRCDSEADRDEWMAQIQATRVRAIRQGLGHVTLTDADRRANKAGELLFKRDLEREQRDNGFRSNEGSMFEMTMMSGNAGL